jgi:prepilin-type N-terminal cleavage/methylation domain-containing protein
MKEGKRKNGFTLIEILIVIAVLAILYWIASSRLMSMQTEAKIAMANGDLKTLKFALDTHIVRNKVCPVKENYQRVLSHEMPNIIFGDLIDPFGTAVNTLYPFEISDNRQSYVVYSIGPRRNGKAAVGNDGRVLTEGAPLFETNGFN